MKKEKLQVKSKKFLNLLDFGLVFFAFRFKLIYLCKK